MATMITLKCGDRLYKCPKERLIAHSDYFKALFSNSSAFADSAKTEFDYNELMQQQLICSTGLEHVVDYINTGALRTDLDLQTLINIAKTASWLQCVDCEEKAWALVDPLLLPGHCFSNSKLLYFQSLGSLRVLRKTLHQALWKVAEPSQSDDVCCLTYPEMYCLLKNPNLQDTTGGIEICRVINKYIISKTKDPNSAENESLHPDILNDLQSSLRSMFLFAMLEGLAKKFSRSGMLSEKFSDIDLLPEFPSVESSNKPTKIQKLSTNDNEKNACLLTLSEKNPVPSSVVLTAAEARTILLWREDDNVFNHCLAFLKDKKAWKACTVSFRTSETSEEGCKIYYSPVVTSFDYKSKRLEVLTDLPDIKQGSKVTSFGSQILLVGGESIIGKNKFLELPCTWDYRTRMWYNLNMKGFHRRSFSTCWLSDLGLVLLGGYGTFRKRVYSVDILEANLDSDASYLKNDTMWSFDSRYNAPALLQFDDKRAGGSGEKSLQYKLESLVDLPAATAVQSDNAVWASSEHLMLLTSKALNMYCPGHCCWHQQIAVSGEFFPGGANGAFPFGVGTYFISTFHSEVYWLLTDPELLKEDNELPKFHFIKYGKFSENAYSVVQSYDKLYNFTSKFDTDEPIVEILSLDYNPLERLGNGLMFFASEGPLQSTSCHGRPVITYPMEKKAAEKNVTDTTCVLEISLTSELFRRSRALEHRPSRSKLRRQKSSESSEGRSGKGCDFCESYRRAERMKDQELSELQWKLQQKRSEEVSIPEEDGIVFRSPVDVSSCGAFSVFDPFDVISDNYKVS